MRFKSLIAIAGMLISASAMASDYTIGNIHVSDPRARATAPAQPAGAVYLTLENLGKSPEKLIAAASPVAKTAEIHTMSMQNNVMSMREVSGIELQPSDKISMQPGHGYHIMLMGLKQPLKLGDTFPLTLKFDKSGTLKILVSVEDLTVKSATTNREIPIQHHH